MIDILSAFSYLVISLCLANWRVDSFSISFVYLHTTMCYGHGLKCCNSELVCGLLVLLNSWIEFMYDMH